MRRRYVSETELQQIIKLKQNGASWLRIEKETGVPRRTAMNAYEEWEHTKSREELKRARTAIAEEEFRMHMDDLVSLSQALVASLYVPTPTSKIEDANEVFDNLWKKDIREGSKAVIGEQEERRVIRQNKMLYKGLQEHTDKVVRWQALEEWRQGFNEYMRLLSSLRSDVSNVTANMLEHDMELKVRIEAASGGKEIKKKMKHGILEAIWRGTRSGDANLDKIKGNIHIQATSRFAELCEISFGKDASFTIISVKEENLGAEIAKFCRIVADNICRGKKSQLLLRITEDTKKMEQCIEELEGSLDELLLRPAILRTKCYLCPV